MGILVGHHHVALHQASSPQFFVIAKLAWLANGLGHLRWGLLTKFTLL